MASVTVDDVRDVINISLAEVPDAKILKMLKRAEVALELELGKEIDYQNCTDSEKEFITVLAAIYSICYLSGGSAVGLSFSVGDQNVSVLSNAPPLDVLRSELQRMLERLKGNRKASFKPTLLRSSKDSSRVLPTVSINGLFCSG